MDHMQSEVIMTNLIFHFDGQDTCNITLTRFKIHDPYILLTKY